MSTKIENSLIYIAKNFRLPLTGKLIAENSNISEFHFYRAFRKEKKCSPQKYLEQIRMEHAIHMMKLNSNIKKTHLAFECGFNSPSSFNRTFKKYYSMSPSAYQNKKYGLHFNTMDKNESSKINIKYLPQLHLKTNLITPETVIINRAIRAKKYNSATVIFGVFLDAPFHKKLGHCRYLIGRQVKTIEESNYSIDQGYYLSIKVKGTVEKFKSIVLKKYSLLENLGYYFKEPIAFEKYFLNDYMEQKNYSKIKRQVLIPISKKEQDM